MSFLPDARATKSPDGISRRTLLGSLAAGAVASAVNTRVSGAQSAVGSANARSADAFRLRIDAARFEQRLGQAAHYNNGDEERFPRRFANYSKGLPHNFAGEVHADAYDSLLRAVSSGDPADFERVQLAGDMRLINPLAGVAFDLQGADSHALGMRAAPPFDSAEAAAEIAENYWMAVARDVPFNDYAGHPLIEEAAADLSRMQDFRGPREFGRITAATLFRGTAPGATAGPYVSQFLSKRTPFGAEEVDRRIHSATPGVDHLTNYDEWLAIQNGAAPVAPFATESERRYLRNGRDLATWVHDDVLFQAYFEALLVLFDLDAPVDHGHPYRASHVQSGFGTFGEPHVASAVCAVATKALKAVWFQKWFVHRRLRPEAFAGRVHNHLTRAASYPIHRDILESSVLPELFARNGSYLLPMAYPEGAPLHPSYGAGHATVAGACTTVLKAFFDESATIPDPVVAASDGLSLQPYSGADLTVGGELNKLAWNIAMARDFAGVHWHSDAVESLRLGEEVAIRYLAEERSCFGERFNGFSLTRFDGTTVVV